jgi:hypothetical protein
MMNRPTPIVAAPLVNVLPPSDQETVPSIAGGPQTTTPLAATDFTFQQIHDLTSSETGASTSAVGESSLGSMGNNTIFYTANWFAARSTDGGSSFTYISPYTTFPSINGGFCCDQVVQYAQNQDMLIWSLLYVPDSTSGTLRIATAVGSTNVANNSWIYWDWDPQKFGFASGNWLDFPNLTIGSTNLYVTANVFSISNNIFTGSVIFRIPLSQLAGGIANATYYTSTLGDWRCTEGASTTMYCGTTSIGGNKVRILRWDDSSTTLFWDDVQLSGFTYMNPTGAGGVAFSPDGTNWAAYADSRILGSWVSGGAIGLMFSARQDASFPYPYTIVARFDESTRTLLTQTPIWNSNYAYLYPSVSVNAAGNLAGIIAYGGGPLYPNEVAWISDDVHSAFAPLEAYTATAGNHGPSGNRWGDYFSSRRQFSNPYTWIAGAYDLTNGGENSNVSQRFLWFGRVRDFASSPPAAPTLILPSNAATGVALTPTLSWNAASGATSYDVYFGNSSSPPYLSNTTGTSYSLGALLSGTTYYWEIVARNSVGSTSSATWSFTTQLGGPLPPTLVWPSNGAIGVATMPTLSWSSAAGATSYDVYFGTSSTPPYATNTSSTGYSPGTLITGTTYYWRIVARNSAGVATSSTWSFITRTKNTFGDFNGDGFTDLIWQDPVSGRAQVWYLGGTQGVTTIGAANLTLLNTWRIVGVADFDRDGHPDVVWQDPVSGAAQVWFMGGAGGNVVTGAAVLSYGNSWRIMSVADFNRDGIPDVIWQDQTSGWAQIWFMGGPQGTTLTSAVNLTLRNTWRIAGTGDFNGDGVPDVVWQDPATGAVQIWYMGGTQGNVVQTAVNLTSSSTSKVASIADFNGDGHPDIVWQDPGTGAADVSFLGGPQGTTTLGTASMSNGNSWRIMGPR